MNICLNKKLFVRYEPHSFENQIKYTVTIKIFGILMDQNICAE